MLVAVSFASDAVVYAAGRNGTILKSSDTGASWRALDVPTEGHIVGIDFANENVGYAVSPEVLVEQGPSGEAISVGGLLVTRDGGETWTVVTEAETYLAACPCGETCQGLGGVEPEPDIECTRKFSRLTSLHAFSADVVLVMDGGGYHRTEDGGAAWVGERTTDGDNLSCVEGGTCLVSGTHQDLARGNDEHCYEGTCGALSISRDGGLTWTRQIDAQTPYLTDISAVSDMIVYGIGGWALSSGTVYRSGDGGVTWNELPNLDTLTDPGPASLGGAAYRNLPAVHFVDANVGFGAGNRVTPDGGLVATPFIVATDDAGENWRVVHDAADPGHLLDVDARAGNLVAVGDEGLIVRLSF
jgi:photosystem II stability/assembly factor-like uncharacterized protein